MTHKKARTQNGHGLLIDQFKISLCVADDGEILSLEGSTAYKTAVDVLLREETCCVLSIAGAAVLNCKSSCCISIIEFSDNATDECANFLSLLVCSSLACADSPDRLISDSDLAELVSRDILESANDLTLDPVECLTSFTLSKRLTAADDRSYTILEESKSLLVNCLVCLCVVFTSLGVADDAVIYAHLSKPER